MWVLRAILITALIICVVAFAYYNTGPDQTVDVNLVYAQYLDVPLVTVVFWSFVAGMLVSLLVFISIWIKQTMQVTAGRRRLRALEQEVAVLRNRPIEESADLLKGADAKRDQDATKWPQIE